jgi:hypothetical protein
VKGGRVVVAFDGGQEQAELVAVAFGVPRDGVRQVSAGVERGARMEVQVGGQDGGFVTVRGRVAAVLVVTLAVMRSVAGGRAGLVDGR